MFQVLAHHVTQRRRWIRQLGVGVAAATMVTGLAACGGDSTGSSGDEVMTAATANLEAAKTASFTFSLTDPNAVVAASSNDPEMVKKFLSDAALTITIDPAGDNTLGQASTATPTTGTQMLEQAGAMDLTYTVGGEQRLGLRLVDGSVYVKADLAALSDMAGEDLEAMLATVPGDYTKLVDGIKNGKWVKVDLRRVLQEYPEIDSLLMSESGVLLQDTTVNTQEMQKELLTALNENSEKTVSTDGDTSTVELKVKAKAFAQAVQNLLPAAEAAGLDDASSDIEDMGDGTMDMSVTVKDDHFTSATLNLSSAQAVLEPDSDVDLTGAELVMDVNDAAEGVTAPDAGDVVDATDMLMEFVMEYALMMSDMGEVPSEMTDLS
jgi:hypothetical protein